MIRHIGLVIAALLLFVTHCVAADTASDATRVLALIANTRPAGVTGEVSPDRTSGHLSFVVGGVPYAVSFSSIRPIGAASQGWLVITRQPTALVCQSFQDLGPDGTVDIASRMIPEGGEEGRMAHECLEGRLSKVSFRNTSWENGRGAERKNYEQSEYADALATVRAFFEKEGP